MECWHTQRLATHTFMRDPTRQYTSRTLIRANSTHAPSPPTLLPHMDVPHTFKHTDAPQKTHTRSHTTHLLTSNRKKAPKCLACACLRPCLSHGLPLPLSLSQALSCAVSLAYVLRCAERNRGARHVRSRLFASVVHRTHAHTNNLPNKPRKKTLDPQGLATGFHEALLQWAATLPWGG